MAEVAFAISLQDQITPGAKSAAASLGQAEGALKKTGAAGDSVAGKLAKTGTSASKAADKTVDLGKAAKGAFPFLGELQERASNLGAGLGGISTASTIAILGLAAVAAAAAAAAAAFVYFGIKSADAAMHLRAVSIAQTGSVEAGTALAASVSDIATRTGVATDKLGAMAGKLAKAGVSGRDMDSALSAAAGTAALFGDSAADAFVESALEAQKAGKSVGKFAADAKAKLGPGLAMELARPSVAAQRLGDSIADIFGGADVSGFGAAINGISDALARGSAVGDALRTVFEALFGGLGAGAQSAGGIVVAVLEEMTILALKVAIAVKPAARYVGELWAAMTTGSGAATTINVIKAGMMALGAAFVAAGVMAVTALAPVAVAVLAATWPVLAIGAAVMALGFIWLQWGDTIKAAIASAWEAVSGFVAGVGAGLSAFGGMIAGGFSAAWGAIAGFVAGIWSTLGELVSGAAGLAGNFIAGLVGGISSGVGMVVDAISNLASSALGAFRGILGIASPSRVMLQMGGYTSEGFASGMDAGAADVAASASDLAATPIKAAEAAPAPKAAAGGRGGGGGGGGSIDVGGLTITINGVAGAESILERLPAALADAFEQIAESMGVSPAEA